MGGALVLQLAAEHDAEIAGVIVVNPAVATKRKDVKLLPVLKHVVPSFPAIANDIKKPGQDEYGYPKTPLKAAHSMMSSWPGVVDGLGRITKPVLYFRSTEDHVVDELSEGLIKERLGSTDVTWRTAREQLPRRDPRPRRPAHLRGVRGFHRARDGITLVR